MTLETQLESYNKISSNGVLSGKRRKFLNILEENGPLTVREIHAVWEQDDASIRLDNVHSRANELVKTDAVKISGSKICEYSKMRVSIYEATGLEPDMDGIERKNKKGRMRKHIERMVAAIASNSADDIFLIDWKIEAQEILDL